MHFTPSSEYVPASPKLKAAPCFDLPEAEKDIFYSTSGSGYRRAKAICKGCSVRQQCLEIALTHEPPGSKAGGYYPMRFGVWGGLTARERERMFGGDDASEMPEV